MERRRFLGLLTGSLTAVLGAVAAVPLLGRALAPLRRRVAAGGAFLAAGRLEDFPLGRPTRVALPVTVQDGWVRKTVRQAAWVLREESGLRVLSTVCPHLGCSVNWKESRDGFECPCHESGFSRSGDYLHGPARRGLDDLPFEVVGGELRIRWVEFETGSAESRPVGGAPA